MNMLKVAQHKFVIDHREERVPCSYCFSRFFLAPQITT